MDEATLKKIIKECYDKGSFANLTNLLPYEIRYSLFIGDVERKYMKFLYDTMIEHLFTVTEAEMLFNQIDNKEKRAYLSLLLGDAKKMTLINDIVLDGQNAAKFIHSIKDEQSKFIVAITFLKRNLINQYYLTYLLGEFNKNYKIQLLDKFLTFYSDGEYKISENDYAKIISRFDEDDRFFVFKLLIDRSGNKTFSYLKIELILKILPEEQREECLNYILDKFANDYKASFYMVEGILAEFPEEKFIQILTIILDKGLLDKYSISHMLQSYSFDKNLKIVDYLIEYGKKNKRSLIVDFTITALLDNLSREDGIKVYQKYAMDMEGFGDINIALNCRKVEDKYFYLDYWLGQCTIKSFDDIFETIDSLLAEMDISVSGVEEYPHLIDIYAKRYQVNRTHLREFIKRFNYATFRFLISKNVREIINLPDEEFVKFVNIFIHGVMLDNDMINTVCNSFLQREFRLVNGEDYSIFSQFEELLYIKNAETSQKVAQLLSKIGEAINLNSYLAKNEFTFDQFLNRLIDDDKTAIDLLHTITQEYIMRKRENFVREKLATVYDDLNVIRKIDKSFYKKRLLEVASFNAIRLLFKSIPDQYLNDEENMLINNKVLLESLLKFKKEQVPFKDQSEKKFLKVLESLLNKAYEYKYDEKEFMDVKNLPYVYYPFAPSDEWLLGIIVECNVEQIVDKLLNNEDLYEKLIAFIKKYKMLGWNKTFACFEDRAEMEFSEATMASIISNFYTIYPIAREKSVSLTQFIDYANCYDSLSKTYSYLLDKDNYRAIVANEGKNKAVISKIERLKRIPNLIRGMYERIEITTPPIDKNYTTSTGKTINVVLGNSTNMINLSYGERTNSCLRIGGAFNSLFEFCIHDKNGFHVRFSDSESGKFISRVSGIRNGNTIFFNELRDTENADYSNEDIIEVLKILSAELIEMTKGEVCPIDNVAITYDLAMADYEKEAIPTNLSSHPNVFYGKNFNIRLDGKFVLLKSTHPNGELVPYKFGADLAQTYETQRDKVVTFNDPELAYERVVKLRLIDGVLKGQEIDEVPINISTNIESCIAGEDWCVYRDTEGNIHQFIVEMTGYNEKALSEMKEALKKLHTAIDQSTQNKVYGG